MTVNSTELALKRTKFANERTYLAYMRTGFGIAAVAGAFKAWWLCGFGALMIVLSSVHYVLTIVSLNNEKNPKHEVMEYLPLVYVVLAAGVLYMQWNKPLKKSS